MSDVLPGATTALHASIAAERMAHFWTVLAAIGAIEDKRDQSGRYDSYLCAISKSRALMGEFDAVCAERDAARLAADESAKAHAEAHAQLAQKDAEIAALTEKSVALEWNLAVQTAAKQNWERACEEAEQRVAPVDAARDRVIEAARRLVLEAELDETYDCDRQLIKALAALDAIRAPKRDGGEK